MANGKWQMGKLTIFAACSFLIAAHLSCPAALAAQAPAPAAPPAAQNAPTSAPEARKEDVSSLDAILAALYDVISGPAGQARDWNRFRSLFAPGARLIPTGLTPEGQRRITVV